MAITIRYASTRTEIWRYYWRMWRQQLWKAHVVVFGIVAVFTYCALPAHRLSWIAAIVAGGAVIAFFMVYPLLRYKPEMRELTISDEGIRTSIGLRRGDIAWNDVAALDVQNDALVIRRSNLNGLIVPVRAFATPDEQAAFEAFVRCHTGLNRN
ncbi:YcxB family protein [uncultured Sphingomonas sp.]|uniref:YcxB family protein n=1 Tax=uncultured Sphingomonas sp. TaxID=158754 RepID=UPI0025F393E9|nr:YcxB family protein [uncultured Sphingomonas sp.]